MKLKGDTLIEVALAIGIFSLVAITVVSVVSASTSSAQSALETTITREELDAQAEALRFIHDSYVSGSQSQKTSENPYAELWNYIVKEAVERESQDAPGINDNYKPQTCSELYKDGQINTENVYSKENVQKEAFVINIRELGSLKTGVDGKDSNKANIVIKSNEDNKVFYPPDTYPRILYGETKDLSEQDDYLYDPDALSSTKIKRIEGIYIVVERGRHVVIEGADTNAQDLAAYFDFYIRSCWMPLGSDRASSVSTVVRLYDPATICYADEATCKRQQENNKK